MSNSVAHVWSHLLRGGLGSGLASTVGLLSGSTWPTMGREYLHMASFIHTIFQPNEGPRCGYRAKCGVAQSI